MMSKRPAHPAGKHRALVRAIGFVKTTLLGGAVFLVPLIVVAVLAARAGSYVRRLGRPLDALLPVHRVYGVLLADVLSILFLVILCFFAGLLTRVSLANRFLRKAEAGVLWSIPGYGFLKGLTDSLDRGAAATSMIPVLVRFADCAQLAFEVDRLPDGRRVVYVPSAPDPRAGMVFVMEAHRVEALPMTFLKTLSALRSLGRGVGPAFRSLQKGQPSVEVF
jgi:uncharacterized membrane protein